MSWSPTQQYHTHTSTHEHTLAANLLTVFIREDSPHLVGTFLIQEDACISIVAQWQGLTNRIRSMPERAHSCSGDTQLHAPALQLDTELLLKVSGVRH